MPKPKKFAGIEKRQTRGSEIKPGVFSVHFSPKEGTIRHDERHKKGFYHSVTTHPQKNFSGAEGFAVTHSRFNAKGKKPVSDIYHSTQWFGSQEKALSHHRKVLRGIIPRQQEK